MEMKKKVNKKKKPSKQKIDIVIESLVHLEQQVKELIKGIKNLEDKEHRKDYSLENPEPKFLPSLTYKHGDITWNFTEK